ncbi:MAG TPA: zinc ribbon domain-containing protein [Gemmatimonadales bacterium]|jgi:putative FmdB family regulatory protein|nr:zinc ribbon domain-containing protein [Gemmatimonadales bacterium]
MPTYEFKCPKGHVFEKFYPTITKTRRLKCPKCGKMAERLISGGAGLVFKGSGFYITDYKRAGEKVEKTEKAEKTDKAAKVEKTPEAKPKPKKDSSSDK